MREKIFEMDNDGFTGVKWKKTTSVVGGKTKTKGVSAQTASLTEGECFGYSTIWVTDMLKGKEPSQTEGGILRAGLLQQKAELRSDWKKAVQEVISDLGFKVGQMLPVIWSDTPRRLSSYQAYFLVDIGVHWTAMGRRGQNFYFFDPNGGLDRWDNQVEFISEVKSELDWYQNNGWMTNPGSVCNCYEVRIS